MKLNLNQAINYGKSLSTGPPIENSEICQISNRAISRKKLSIFSNIKEFEYMGPGIPLFFKYI